MTIKMPAVPPTWSSGPAPDILTELAFYIVNRREQARNNEIRTTSDKPTQVLLNAGMGIAYDDVLDFLSGRGVEINSMKK